MYATVKELRECALMNITTDDTLCWYAMSAPYNREKKAAQLLNEQGLEFFIPMRRYDKIVKASRRIKEVPVVRNLLFVHGTKKDLLKIKTDYCANDFLQFKMRTMRNGTKQHIIIPDKQMSDFITIYNSKTHDNLIYLEPDDIRQLRENALVRIIDGPYKDCVGYYQRVKGTRDKRFVVRLDFFMACATSLTECSIIKVEEE